MIIINIYLRLPGQVHSEKTDSRCQLLNITMKINLQMPFASTLRKLILHDKLSLIIDKYKHEDKSTNARSSAYRES